MNSTTELLRPLRLLGPALWAVWLGTAGCSTDAPDAPDEPFTSPTVLRTLNDMFGVESSDPTLLPTSLADRDGQLRNRAEAGPTGPQPVTVYLRRGESLADIAKWASKDLEKLALDNELLAAETYEAGTPVHMVLTADELDAFEAGRDSYHDAYRSEFAEKYAVRSTRTHTVRSGDSAWKLARLDQHPVPLWLLEDYNPGLNLKTLQVGQTLSIPVLGEAGNAPEAGHPDRAGAPEPQAPAEDLVIRVQSGESLSHYAAWSGLSVADIASYNGVSDPRQLRVGQSLRLPVPEARVGEFYRKRSGRRDGPAAVAAAARPSAAAPAPAPAPAAERRTSTYKVRPGDSAWVIATRRFGISLDALQALNPKVDFSRLQSGDELTVPAR